MDVTANAQLRKGALSQVFQRTRIQGSGMEILRETIFRGGTWVCDCENVVCTGEESTGSDREETGMPRLKGSLAWQVGELGHPRGGVVRKGCLY